MSTTEYILLASLSGVAIYLWSISVWGGWAEKLYERKKDSYWSWYWLRLAGVGLTKNNRIRFVKVVSLLGIVLVTVSVFTATQVFLQK